ncbi:hypothetical protein B0H11DRAFT_153200 [Mycena galericulata]|nr:hypothetical protein B0H11DRAFT_153200 [Mycena galericulata]
MELCRTVLSKSRVKFARLLLAFPISTAGKPDIMHRGGSYSGTSDKFVALMHDLLLAPLPRPCHRFRLPEQGFCTIRQCAPCTAPCLTSIVHGIADQIPCFPPTRPRIKIEGTAVWPLRPHFMHSYLARFRASAQCLSAANRLPASINISPSFYSSSRRCR